MNPLMKYEVGLTYHNTIPPPTLYSTMDMYESHMSTHDTLIYVTHCLNHP